MKASSEPTADDSSTEAMGSPSLTKSALGGVAWNSAGSAVLVLAQVASTIATARLVSPHEFGFYATAQAATGVVGYVFTISALGSGIQRRSRLGEKTVGTALTLSLAISLVLGGGLFVGASLWARAWGLPEAAAVVRVIALTLFLTSAATIPVALIRRRLEFGRAAIIETGSQVVAMGVGVALAIQLHSAIALATGQAVGAAILLVAAGAIVRRELRPSFHRSDARELLTFASQVSGLTFGAYLIQTAPAWFTARTFGASTLGVYSRAQMIVGLPAAYATTSVFKVIYPLYGRVRHDLGRTRTLINEALTLTTGVTWPLLALIAGASPVIVSVLLGPRWDAAVSLIPLFALAMCAYIPCGVLTNAAEAMGWMKIIAARQMALLVGVVATLVASYVAGLGLTWVLAGLAASEWAAFFLTISPFVRRRLLVAESVAREQAIHATVALASYGAAAVGAHATAAASLAVQVMTMMGVGLLVFGVLVIFHRWFPAGRVLRRRLVQVAPRHGGIGSTVVPD